MGVPVGLTAVVSRSPSAPVCVVKMGQVADARAFKGRPHAGTFFDAGIPPTLLRRWG